MLKLMDFRVLSARDKMTEVSVFCGRWVGFVVVNDASLRRVRRGGVNFYLLGTLSLFCCDGVWGCRKTYPPVEFPSVVRVSSKDKKLLIVVTRLLLAL